jgi:hypothetical protein
LILVSDGARGTKREAKLGLASGCWVEETLSTERNKGELLSTVKLLIIMVKESFVVEATSAVEMAQDPSTLPSRPSTVTKKLQKAFEKSFVTRS